MACTNGITPGKKEWLTQGGEVQAVHLIDWKGWTLLTFTEHLAAEGAASFQVEIALLLSC